MTTQILKNQETIVQVRKHTNKNVNSPQIHPEVSFSGVSQEEFDY